LVFRTGLVVGEIFLLMGREWMVMHGEREYVYWQFITT
jgi:hypothetical protein